MTEITQIISSVGFPIAMCILMGYYIKHTNDTHREDLRLQQENHRDTSSRLAIAIEENTAVLEELSGIITYGMNGGESQNEK